jgi:hypothetical protein
LELDFHGRAINNERFSDSADGWDIRFGASRRFAIDSTAFVGRGYYIAKLLKRCSQVST